MEITAYTGISIKLSEATWVMAPGSSPQDSPGNFETAELPSEYFSTGIVCVERDDDDVGDRNRAGDPGIDLSRPDAIVHAGRVRRTGFIHGDRGLRIRCCRREIRAGGDPPGAGRRSGQYRSACLAVFLVCQHCHVSCRSSL